MPGLILPRARGVYDIIRGGLCQARSFRAQGGSMISYEGVYVRPDPPARKGGLRYHTRGSMSGLILPRARGVYDIIRGGLCQA